MKVVDRGAFTLYAYESPVARVEFSWRGDGAYHGTVTLDYAGQSIEQSLRISVNPPAESGHASWSRIDIEQPAGPATVIRDGSRLLYTHRGRTVSHELPRRTNPVDRNNVALFAPVLCAYDVAAGGRQGIPIYAIGQGVAFAVVERKGELRVHAAGRDRPVVRWAVEVPGAELEILAERSGRVLAVSSIGQDGVYVRDGFEALLPGEGDGDRVSRPRCAVEVDRNVMAAMRDGVELAADVYRPAGPGEYPTILVRTPYKKEIDEVRARYFARRGYACVIQDVRGRFSSQGAWQPFVNERQDGYDSVEWAARQPWSNGKVGMLGASYLGWAQWLAAAERPPHLVTIIPSVAPPDPFLNLPYEHGVFFLKAAVAWAATVDSEATADISGLTVRRIHEQRFSELLRPLPVIDLDKSVLGGESRYWREWISHPVNDEYWRRASYLDDLAGVDLPVFHQSGWFDGDGIGSKLAHARMTAHGHRHQKLILGPWGHTDQATRMVNDLDFGPEAVAIDLQREYLRWLDRWLKGIDNGVESEPLVRVFAMGSNRWLTGDTYPLEGTIGERWYLHPAGLLEPVPPQAGDPFDEYRYDPGDPTPDPDHREEPAPGGDAVIPAEAQLGEHWRGRDEVVRRRPDILVYSSAAFEAEVTYAGPVSAVLYAATTAVDTDWHMRVVDVGPEGRSLTLASGRLRARFHRSLSEPELLRPGEVYVFRLDLWQTGITIKRGHRLRVEVASAAFPTYSRNLNSGGHNEVETAYVSAVQTVWHTAARPSHVVMPRVPAPVSA